MILASHSDAAYFNETCARSRAGLHIFCSDNDPIPCNNGPVLSLAQIINVVLSSASEAELSGLFVTSKATVPLRQTLEEIKRPQPRYPIQMDESTANAFANETIVPKKIESMDMRFYWFQCRDSQGQFRYYWAPGTTNRVDYHTKRYPPQYHELYRPWSS